ncbi:MAG: hypothetical protein LBE25_10975 [Arthrobacter sp.]|nr:hypothetical protein [Arthrobacter sp.]
MRTRPLVSLALLAPVAALALSACGPSSPSGVSPTPAGSSLATPYSAEPTTAAPSATEGSASAIETPTTVPGGDTGEPTVSLSESAAVVTLFGSSTCPPAIESSAIADGVLKVTAVQDAAQVVCTADLAPHEFSLTFSSSELQSVTSAVLVEKGLERSMQLLR